MSLESENSLLDWIALSFVIGVGSRTAAMLIDKRGSPAAVFDSSAQALESAGLRRDTIDAIKSSEPQEKAAREIEELARLGGEAVTLANEKYPELLRETYDPPIVIYCLGDFASALSRPAVAIVGSRRCSTYGRNVAEKLSRELAERGVTVVSGLARGIDSAAHRGALDGRGLTVGVMGTGLDAVYPKENRKLAARISEQGALVTEFPLATPPVSQNFPFRNRVISGLALGVMVVEGAERSGSLITARLAYEQGRDVFAVPGNITSAKSFGPNYLIKDGAKLVQTWRDVIEELPADMKAAILSAERGEQTAKRTSVEVELTDPERRVLKMLNTDDPVHIDLLIAKAGLGSGELMGTLLKLEMLDRIRQLPREELCEANVVVTGSRWMGLHLQRDTTMLRVFTFAVVSSESSKALGGCAEREDKAGMSVQFQKHCFNVSEYHRMAEVGLLSEDSRVELIEGEIIEMSPIGSTHGGTVKRSSTFLNRTLGDTVIVSVQDPIRLSDFSEPQPDLALLKPRKDFYSASHPKPEDVLVVIEVADTSVHYDRNVKLPLYACAGIPEAWLMVLEKNLIEVHSQPKNGKYQKIQRLKRGKTLVSPTIPSFSCKVEDLLS